MPWQDGTDYASIDVNDKAEFKTISDYHTDMETIPNVGLPLQSNLGYSAQRTD